MGRRIVKKFQHQRMPLEYLLDDTALHSAAAAVYETHFGKPGGVRLVNVLFDDGRNVLRSERMEVEGALDRDAERVALSEAEGVLILHR